MSEPIFPSRVTQGEDGVYRWTYTLDMKHNLFVFRFVFKLLMLITLGVDVILLALGMDDISRMLPFVLIFTVAMAAIWGISYVLWGLCVHWEYRTRFEMDGEAIAAVPAPSEAKRSRILSALVAVAGLASKRPLQAIGTSAAIGAGAYPSVRKLKKVRSLRQQRKDDAIILRQLISGIQVFVPREDYDFVLGFLREHLPEGVETPKRLLWPRRLAFSALLSLAVNGVALAINSIVFSQKQSLPLSVRFDAGGAVEWRAFAMRAYYFQEDCMDGWQMVYDFGLGVIGFLLVALAIFLVWSLLSLVFKKNRR